MTQLGEAIALAAEVHKHQVDKGDVTYILHPLAVMQRATDYYIANSDGWRIEDVQIAAVLHDVLEDLDANEAWAPGRLRDRIYRTFSKEIYTAVDALTKYPGDEYDKYLNRLAKNWIARIVKIADLSHNLDAFRLPIGKISDKDFDRWDKYHRALVFLTEIESGVNAQVR